MPFISIGREAHGLLNQIQAWKSQDGDQRLIIGASIHNLGNDKENKEQMNYFINNLLIPCEKSSRQIQVLFEGDLLYYLVEIDENKLANIRKVIDEVFPKGNTVNSTILGKEPPVFFTLESDNNYDWIQDELIKNLSKGNIKLKNIVFESIDPRMPLHLWADSSGLLDTSYKDLEEMGKYNQEISDLIKNGNSKNIKLKQVLINIIDNTQKDIKNAFSQFKKEEIDLVKNNDNLTIAKKGHLRLLKRFASYLIGDRFVVTPKFASKLDEEVVWKIANTQAKKRIVLLIGSGHLKALGNYLQQLGYKIEYDIRGAETSTFSKNPDDSSLFLAPNPTKVNEAMITSRNFLGCSNN